MSLKEKIRTLFSRLTRGISPKTDSAADEREAVSEKETSPSEEALNKEESGSSLPLDKREGQFFRLALIIVLGTLFVMVFTFVVSFLATLRGKEQTMVPDLHQVELVQGLIDLQEKELYPRVQVRFSSNPADKGRIIDQDPGAGTVVKAGKRVTLVVSKGSIVDKVGSYVGQDLTQVRMDIQALFTSQRPLLRIKEPVVYIYDETPAGTILEQKPQPGTEISGLTEMELWVSRGPKGDTITVDKFTGMDYADALDTLIRNNMVFTFQVKETENAQPGTILSQSPAPDTEADRGDVIELIMSAPQDLEEDEVFGLFQLTLQDFSVAVDMRLESVSLSGITEKVAEFKHPGGEISIPYVQKVGRDLILYVYDREVHRITVEQPQEEE